MPTLREARTRRLFSVRALAEAARVSPTTINLVETGRRLPHFGTMRKIAQALDLEPGEIAEFAGGHPPSGGGKSGRVE